MDGVAATLGKGSKCKMKFNKEMVTILENGTKVIVLTKHGINFLEESGNLTVAKPAGFVLDATIEETEVPSEIPGVTFVETKKCPTQDGLEFINTVPEGIVIVGSLIAAQAYDRVVAVTSAPGYERMPNPADKRMSTTKFTVR